MFRLFRGLCFKSEREEGPREKQPRAQLFDRVVGLPGPDAGAFKVTELRAAGRF